MQITKWLVIPAAFAALAACERADEDNAALNVDANLATDNLEMPADNMANMDMNNVTDDNMIDNNVTDNTANNTTY